MLIKFRTQTSKKENVLIMVRHNMPVPSKKMFDKKDKPEEVSVNFRFESDTPPQGEEAAKRLIQCLKDWVELNKDFALGFGSHSNENLPVELVISRDITMLDFLKATNNRGVLHVHLKNKKR